VIAMLRLATNLTAVGITLAALTALATPAAAQTTGALPPAMSMPATPMLKRDVTVESDLVRIGDVLENPGAGARVPIFRAPDLGQTGTVSAARVMEALRPHGFTIVETHGVSEIAVTRAARTFTVKDLEARIAEELAGQFGLGEAKNLTVTIERDAKPVQLEPNAGDLRAGRILYDRSGRFDMTFDVPGSSAARRTPLRFIGTVVETVETAVLTRGINRGEVVKASDVAIERRPKADIHGDINATSANLVGLAAKRGLRAGDVLHGTDLMKPEIVQRNENVTLVYEAPGLVLTIRGKALETGALGDTVNVLNIQSKRNVQGTISGPGQVSVTAATHVFRQVTRQSETSGEDARSE
jgi:flagella basal body P-ring formation protein FlgA